MFFCLVPWVLMAQPFSQLIRKFKIISNYGLDVAITCNNEYLFVGNSNNGYGGDTDTVFVYNISNGSFIMYYPTRCVNSSGGGIAAISNRVYTGNDFYTMKSFDISNILNWIPLQTISGLDKGFLRYLSNDTTIIAWQGHWAATCQFFDISNGNITTKCKVNTGGNFYGFPTRYMDYVFAHNSYSPNALININNLSSCTVNPFGFERGNEIFSTSSGFLGYRTVDSPRKIKIFTTYYVLKGELDSHESGLGLCLPEGYLLICNQATNNQVLYNIFDGTFNHPVNTVFNNLSGFCLFNDNYTSVY